MIGLIFRYARVELTPPGPGELVGVVKGVGGLVKDTLTFRWATVSPLLCYLSVLGDLLRGELIQ